MGRRKIEIQPITHERNRSVTFLKRKNGLFKKAYELGVLCSVDVAVIVFEDRPGHHLKLYQYGSSDIRDIIQRHLHHDGESDTRGPSDFSGNASLAGAKDDADDDEGEEEPEENAHPATRAPKRGADGQLKHLQTDIIKSDVDYIPRAVGPHAQHLSLGPPSLSAHQHRHQHPMSSDRLSAAMHPQKKPRLGISANLDPGRSRSDDSPLSGVVSPESSSRSRYSDHSHEFGGAPRYGMPHRVSQSPHSNNSPPSAHHRQRHPQYNTPLFPTSAQAGTHYGAGGHTPPPPNFIPLQSQADFSASAARGRSASSSGGTMLPNRNVYGSYGNDNTPGGSGGGSGDLYAALISAEQEARANITRRSSTLGAGGGNVGSPFGLDWPVHMPSSGPGNADGNVSSKPGSHSSTSSRSGGSGNGNGAGPGSGTDWLDFLSGSAPSGGPTQ